MQLGLTTVRKVKTFLLPHPARDPLSNPLRDFTTPATQVAHTNCPPRLLSDHTSFPPFPPYQIAKTNGQRDTAGVNTSFVELSRDSRAHACSLNTPSRRERLWTYRSSEAK